MATLDVLLLKTYSTDAAVELLASSMDLVLCLQGDDSKLTSRRKDGVRTEKYVQGFAVVFTGQLELSGAIQDLLS